LSLQPLAGQQSPVGHLEQLATVTRTLLFKVAAHHVQAKLHALHEHAPLDRIDVLLLGFDPDVLAHALELLGRCGYTLLTVERSAVSHLRSPCRFVGKHSAGFPIYD